MISFSSLGSLYSCSSQWFYQVRVGTENLGTVERETSLYFTHLTKMYKLVLADKIYKMVVTNEMFKLVINDEIYDLVVTDEMFKWW